MRHKIETQAGVTTGKLFIALAFCSAAILLGGLSVRAAPRNSATAANNNWSVRRSVDTRRIDRSSDGENLASRLPQHTNPSVLTASGWAIVAAPTAPGPQHLQGINCLSDSDCWAVGYYSTYDDATKTLIEHWDGNSWTIIGSPVAGRLQSVTCASTSQCWAVGYSPGAGFGIQPLIEKWDGNTWTVVSAPNRGNSSDSFYGITCTSASQCWAVGYGGLIEKWDGNSWTIFNSPTTGGLEGVTCTSASNCWAVGAADNAIIIRWDGTSWTLINSPNVGAFYNELHSVTCSSVSECWAVGLAGEKDEASQTLIERWDGNSWTLINSPNSGTSENLLNGVSCESATQCWAVGTYFDPSSVIYKTLIERWNGISWAIVSSPNGSTHDNYFTGITCRSTSGCVAVGYFTQPPDQTLVEKWNGTSWTVIDSPNQATATGELHGVNCASPSQCWGVGTYRNTESGAEPVHTFIQRWNGVSWQTVRSPDPGVFQNGLSGVTCTSTSDCWAVGGYETFDGLNGVSRTLVAKWDGNSWTAFDSPYIGSQGNYLYDVTCLSASNCWAVGYYYATSIGARTLIEHWDGASWTIVSSPNAGTDANFLYAVSCTSASNCWAVGTNSDYTLTLKWDGNSWTIFNAPNTGALQDVTCTSPSECWAVGNTSGGPPHTLITRWNGTSWNLVTSPNPTPNFAYFYGVTCTSSSNCWAVGEYLDTGPPGKDKTLIAHWDGTSWTLTNSPNPAPSSGFLYGVTCSSESQCWSVGMGGGLNDVAPVKYTTLIEEFSLTVPPLTAVASTMAHGASGIFNVDLPLSGSPGIECRSTGGNYDVVFSFVNDVTNCGIATTPGGSVISGPNANQCTEHVTGISNPQRLDIGVNNLVDSQNNSGNISVPMRLLIGDTNSDGSVNSADISQTKSKSGQSVDSSNFRQDVNVDGSINSGDISLVKSKSGTPLP